MSYWEQRATQDRLDRIRAMSPGHVPEDHFPVWAQGDATDVRAQFLQQLKLDDGVSWTDGLAVVVKGKTFVIGKVSQSGGGHIPGEIIMYGAAVAPAGFLLCDGTSYLRTDYPTLFAAIGTTWGAVDGTHFNVPNMKGRFPVGYDAAQAEFNALAKTGGAKTHNHGLTAAAVTSHTHPVGTLAVAGHSHPLSAAGWAQIYVAAGSIAPNLYMRRVTATSYTGTVQGDATVGGSNSGAHTLGAGLDGTTDSVGASITGATGATAPDVTGTTDNVAGTNAMPPFNTLNFIIKT